jgi:hypothetical protein
VDHEGPGDAKGDALTRNLDLARGGPMTGVEEVFEDRKTSTWARLGRRAQAWRIFHASWSVGQLGALGYIWGSAITRHRSPRLWGAVAFLLAEGAALVVGRGNCPMGQLQAEWGDPVPFFELVLPPRAAKAAVPILAVVSVAAVAAVVLRRPGLVVRA